MFGPTIDDASNNRRPYASPTYGRTNKQTNKRTIGGMLLCSESCLVLSFAPKNDKLHVQLKTRHMCARLPLCGTRKFNWPHELEHIILLSMNECASNHNENHQPLIIIHFIRSKRIYSSPSCRWRKMFREFYRGCCYSPVALPLFRIFCTMEMTTLTKW